MPDPYQTVVQVKAIESLGSSDAKTVVVLRGGPPPSHPIAPASLWDYSGVPVRILDLHRLADRDGDELTFLIFDGTEDLPSPGQEFVLQSWWIPQAWDLVTDKSLHWTKRDFPGDHDHCIITWETLGPGDEAYVSDRGDWISVSAYEDFIRDDRLRLRSPDVE